MSFRNLEDMKKIQVFILSGLLLTSCTKKDDVVTEDKNVGTVKIGIENVAGDKPLILDSLWYKTAYGDSLQISIYNYFISNIKLKNEDGTVFAEPESYHLILGNDGKSHVFEIGNVPPGKYTSISFMIGVDSTRNVSGAQTGALDPNSGMFWDWNTGYIMAKMEGKSPQGNGGGLIYHLGGYAGDDNILRTVSLNMNLSVVKGGQNNLHMKADALEWFKTPNTISIKDLSVLTIKTSKPVADNYVDMFTIDHID